MHVILHLVMAVSVLLALYSVIATTVLCFVGARTNALDVRATVKEFIGIIARKLTGSPTLEDLDWAVDDFAFFGLKHQTATPQDIAEAAVRMSEHLDSHPWCYPCGQRAVLQHRADRALRFLARRAEMSARTPGTPLAVRVTA